MLTIPAPEDRGAAGLGQSASPTHTRTYRRRCRRRHRRRRRRRQTFVCFRFCWQESRDLLHPDVKNEPRMAKPYKKAVQRPLQKPPSFAHATWAERGPAAVWPGQFVAAKHIIGSPHCGARTHINVHGLYG